MKVAVLGPGGVGGLLAGALERAGNDVVVVARGIDRGADLRAWRAGRERALGRVHRPATSRRASRGAGAALLVATKASGLEPALERIAVDPELVLPLLNGLDHLAVLRARFAADSVLAGAIRVEADRPEPGVVIHTSPFLLVEMACHDVARRGGAEALARTLSDAGVEARVRDSEAVVMWSKLVRLNALACTTSAHDKLLGEIRSTPALRAELVGAIEESCAVAQAEGAAEVVAGKAIGELEVAHDTLGSSMQRDIAAGRPPELDAIPGSVLRAAARHGLSCPTIERLVAMILARIAAGRPISV